MIGRISVAERAVAQRGKVASRQKDAHLGASLRLQIPYAHVAIDLPVVQ